MTKIRAPWLSALLLLGVGRAPAQTPATCVVSGTVLDGGGAPLANAVVRIRTVPPAFVGGSGIATQDLSTKTNGSGVWSLTLVQALNAQIDILAVGLAKDFVVPSGIACPASFPGTLTLYDRGTLTPATILSDHGPSFGGDLVGASPNPTVIALRGQALDSVACTNGQARVYDSGTSSYVCRTIPTSISGFVNSVTGGTGVTITGPATAPVVNLTTGGVTSTQLGAGAAAANVGTLGGDLAGSTLPNPQIAAGAILDADVNAAAAIAWPKISKAGATAADVGAIATGGAVTSVTGGTGVTITGPATTPVVNISNGGVTSTQLGAGAAATNVGTLGGHLAGALPNPTIASAVVTDAHVAPSAAIAQSKIAGLPTALSLKEDLANKAQPNGYASLDGSGKVPIGQVPSVAPAAHAPSHASGGTDPVSPAAIGAATTVHTHAEADVTSLVADLADRGRKSTTNTWSALQTFSGGISVPGGFSPGGDLTVLAGNPIRIVLATPTGLGATPSASGGSLASGTYYYVVTALDGGGGETVASGEVSAAVTGPTGSVSLSWTTVAGASFRIYRGTAPGAESLYFSTSTNSYVDTGGSGTVASPPGVGTAYAVNFRPAASSWTIGGNLGVGKASPSTALDVNGTATATLFVGPLTGTASGNALATRSIATTSPLTGGGDLSADRTIACATCTTNASALTANGVVYGAGGQAAAATAAGSATQVLHGGTPPTFSAVALAADVSGQLPSANGGLGINAGSSTGFPKAASGVFTIGALIAGDIPTLDASKVGTGQLALARGGTASDLSGTGGVGQVLKQTSLGGAVSVAALVAADIPSPLTSNTSGSAASFTGSLAGDVTGPQGATVVATVAGSTAANVHAAELLANAATSANTASTIVKRDASGNFTASTITGTLSGNATTASDGVTSASGTAPLTLNLAAKALTGNVATMGAASSGSPGSTGVVPAPAAGDQAKCLKGDATWGACSTGSGTVTSVAMTVPGDLSVSGSPVTSSGTLAITRNTQNANLFLAGPPTGAPATPAYRAMVSADLPATIAANTSGSAASFTGSLAGDVTGPQGATVVATVAGSTAANVHAAELLANAATSANTASTIVKRGASTTDLGRLTATSASSGQDMLLLSGTGTPRFRLFDSTPSTGGAVRLEQSGTTTSVRFYDASDSLVATLGTLTPSAAILPTWDKGGAIYNVKAYGAVGDGATDDTAAIAAAITAAGANPGVVFFPRGTYKFSTISTSQSGIRLRGSGSGTTTLTTTTLDATAITLSGSFQELSGVTVTVGGTATASQLSVLVSNTDSLVSDVVATGFLRGLNASAAHRLLVDGLLLDAPASGAVYGLNENTQGGTFRGVTVCPGGCSISTAIAVAGSPFFSNASVTMTTGNATALSVTGSGGQFADCTFIGKGTGSAVSIGSGAFAKFWRTTAYNGLHAVVQAAGGSQTRWFDSNLGCPETATGSCATGDLVSLAGTAYLVNSNVKGGIAGFALIAGAENLNMRGGRISLNTLSPAAYCALAGSAGGAFFGNVEWQNCDLATTAPVSGGVFFGTAVASAATIAPDSDVVRVTGSTTIQTITAPTFRGGREVTLVPAAASSWSLGTAGNIAVPVASTVGVPIRLLYDDVAGKWQPQAGNPIPTLTAGSVPFVGASGALTQDNANLFWDDTNDRLGVGTAAPSNDLRVQKATAGDVTVAVNNSNAASTAARAVVAASNDAGRIMNLAVWGTGATGTRFGLARAGYGESIGNTVNGYLVGTITSAPVVVGTNDVARVTVGAAGDVTLNTGNALVLEADTNGATWKADSWTELITLSTSGTTTDSTNDLPAGALIDAVGCRVTTAISTATAYSVGDPTTAARFISTGGGLTLGSTTTGLNQWKGAVATDAAGPTQLTTAKLRITTTGTPTAGAIRCAVFYRVLTPPTS